MRHSRCTSAVCIALVILLFPSILLPSLRRVPQQYRTIQSAINASSSGDTVLVEDGTYVENILIKKNIVVASRYILDRRESHIERTVIDGSRPANPLVASTVTLNGPTDTTCQLIGFTIRGGRGTYFYVPASEAPPEGPHWVQGGGINVVNTGGRIAHNIIRDNLLSQSKLLSMPISTCGAGIAAEDTTLGRIVPPLIIIEKNTITHNISTGSWAEGGGIDVGQPAVIRQNIITDNRVLSRTRGPAGGIFAGLLNEYDIVIDGNIISRNIAGIAGGLMITSGYVRRGRGIVTNNIIAENESFEVGGAVSIVAQSTAFFFFNTIVQNKARSMGGGIFLPDRSSVTLVNNILWGNSVDQISGWQSAHAMHNIIQGGYPGRNNISADPLFLPNDSLYRLSPNSPAIGTGLSRLLLGGIDTPLPPRDLAGSRRVHQDGIAPDIGAMDSPLDGSSASASILETWQESENASLKLGFLFQQISPQVMSADSLRVLQGGRIVMSLTLNDSTDQAEPDSSVPRTFTLPPGDNLLELEIRTIGRKPNSRLLCSFRLKGADQYFTNISKAWPYRYHAYSGLRPGSYDLELIPQDENNFIDDSNAAMIRIIVLPYWYQQWWALLLFLSGFISIGVAFYRLRMTRMVLKQRVLSERLNTEKAEELNSMKSRFFANITHELRTPLTMIIGPIDTMLTHTTDKNFIDQLGYVKRNSLKLLRLIEQLLHFSRLEAGTIKLHVAPMDVVPYLRRVTGYFTSQAAKKQIEVRFSSAPESIHGLADAEKIEHILQNCLSNALKFTPPGGLVEVNLREEQRQLIMMIRDSGTGIAPEHLPHVFERFYRIDATHKTEGTGIGLSLTKELSEIHHGTIDIQSQPGLGTTVTVRLPLTGYSEAEIVSSPPLKQNFESLIHTSSPLPEEEAVAEKQGLPIILIAEDNDDARGFIKFHLAKQYTVLESPDGDDAINKTKFQIPDLVISDVMMPKKDGWELCAALKQDERTCHIPVILLTALAEKEDRLKGLTTGADDYLVKPFDAQELLTRVQNLLENRKRMREAYGKTITLSPGEISVVSLDDAFLNRLISTVNSHLADAEFGVEQLAHEMFLSRTQLQRKLKAITNLTPSDFIRHLRLQRAKQLLEKNAGTVAEIADSVGFTNHSYFAKCFQEQFGFLPSQVRPTQR